MQPTTGFLSRTYAQGQFDLSNYWIRFRHFIRHFRKPTWLITGNCRASDSPVRLVFRGSETNKNYFVEQFCGEVETSQYFGKRWMNPSQAAHRCQSYRADLLVNEIEYRRVNGASQSVSTATSGIYIPSWVFGELDLTDENLADKRKIRDDLRKIRKHKLHYEISRCSKEFDDFYHTMYVPFVSGAHDDKTVLRGYENVTTGDEDRELFKITMDGEWVAGGVIVYADDGPKGTALGVKNASPEYLKAGVIAAVYHYQREYLLERGYQRFNYGASRGFINDGLLRYKLKWGVELNGFNDSVFHVSPGADPGVFTRFLSRNPSLAVENGVMKVASVVDAQWFDKEQCPLQAIKRLIPRGVSSALVYQQAANCPFSDRFAKRLNEADTSAVNDLPQVELRSAF